MWKLLVRFGAIGFILLIFSIGGGCAQSPEPSPASTAANTSTASSNIDARIQALEQQVAQAQSAGDNSWVLVSSALVLLMTGPGLALFYGGLVRKKHVLATIPQQSYMLFQLMFAIITPALITGAFAERMKFSALCIFMILWSIFVYDPMAHMVWGVGGLLNATSGVIPTLDFAGGTVVHITSGVSALVCALYLGKRVGYPHEPMPPHSVVLSFIGACLLWVGWFGFNAGSALAAGSLASSAFVATQLGAAAAALGWVAAEWVRNKRPSVLGAISGAVAGLVAITPASGFVGPMPSLVIGVVAGVVCYLMVSSVKHKFGYDDSLDAFGVHGIGGTVGALLTGVFAASVINPVFKDSSGHVLPSGLIDGHPGQIVNQLIAVVIAWALAAIVTFILLKIVDLIVGVRVDVEHEIQGLDLTQHGEEAYNLEV